MRRITGTVGQFFPPGITDCKKLYPLSERMAHLGIRGAQLRASFIRYSAANVRGGFREGVSSMGHSDCQEKRQSLVQLYVWLVVVVWPECRSLLTGNRVNACFAKKKGFALVKLSGVPREIGVSLGPVEGPLKPPWISQHYMVSWGLYGTLNWPPMNLPRNSSLSSSPDVFFSSLYESYSSFNSSSKKKKFCPHWHDQIFILQFSQLTISCRCFDEYYELSSSI